MPISTVAGFIGIIDCKIASITEDSSSTLTYGTLVDVPIMNLNITDNYENYELKHDNRVQHIESILQTAELSGTISRVSLDVLAILEGGSVAATGTGANEVQTYTVDNTDTPAFFKLEIKSDRAHADGGDVADVHIIYKKCQITSLDKEVGEDFTKINFTAKAIPTINDNVIKQVVFNETAADIS